MNPWEWVWLLLGWCVLVALACFAVAVVVATFMAIVRPKKRPRAKQIFSSHNE